MEWALGGLVAAVCLAAVVHDFRRDPIMGDQASYLMQTLSLSYDLDLRYDAADLKRWIAIGWEPHPRGLFYQTYRGGAAFAKPYLYSAFVAPFVRLAGVRFGIPLANCAIFILLIGTLFKIARLRFTSGTAALVTLAFVFASNLYFYVFVIHQDLFHALLSAAICYLVLKQTDKSKPWTLFAAAALCGIFISEKPSILFLVSPLLIFGLTKAAEWRHRFGAIATALAAFAICALPYLHYSDYRGWTAYTGTRFFSESGSVESVAAGGTPDGVPMRHKVRGVSSFAEFVRTVDYYFVGAYTGLLIFAPAALFFVIAGCWKSEHWLTALPWTAGIALMIAAYIFFAPTNYFGGEQSVGNRWFLKAMPLALSLAVAAGVTERSGKAIGLGAILFSALTIYPHHLDAVHAFQRCGRSGLLQRCFPLETNQKFVVKLVERERALVNISYVPQRPRWYFASRRDPQMWLWKNEQLVESPCSVRYGHEYLRIGGEQTFALFQQSESGTIYASYGFGHDGIFVSEKSRASLAVSCQSDGLTMALVPFGNTSGVTISSGRRNVHVALPAIVEFAPGGDLATHFRQIDLVGAGYFWMLGSDQIEPAGIRTYPVDVD